jgi:hypothetical protein
MRNQRGEVVIAVMVVMMGVMMIFSGMHMLHGERRYESDRAQIEHRHSRDEGMQYMHYHVDERADIPIREEDK